MMKIQTFSGMLLLLLLASTGFCQEATTPTVTTVETQIVEQATSPTQVTSRDRAIKLLRELEDKYRDVTTISGQFSQLKRNAAFMEEIKSQGVFYFKKPGRFRCEYLPPNESIYILANDIAWLYVPEIKQVEKVYMGQQATKVERLNQLLLGFGVSVSDVLDVYEVEMAEEKKENNTVAIKFTLLKPTPDVNFESVTIWFNIEGKAANRVYLDEVGEDETIIDLKETKVNEEISDALFRPFFPPDVEIIEHY
jgi:outer membrane lipoprotein-sorting protein